MQHEASVKVSDVPRRYNMSSSIGAAAEKEDDDGDWWFLSVFNDPIGASERLLYRIAVQALPSYG